MPANRLASIAPHDAQIEQLQAAGWWPFTAPAVLAVVKELQVCVNRGASY
jgi:hypothetical protein